MGTWHIVSESHCEHSPCILVDLYTLLLVLASVIAIFLLVRYRKIILHRKRMNAIRSEHHRQLSESAIQKDISSAQIQGNKNLDKHGHKFLAATHSVTQNNQAKSRHNLLHAFTGIKEGRSKGIRESTSFKGFLGWQKSTEDVFTKQTYEEKASLAVVPLQLREANELRKITKLKKMRRVSANSKVSFKVSDNVLASVYEVKLQEVHLVKRLATGPLSEVYAGVWRGTKVEFLMCTTILNIFLMDIMTGCYQIANAKRSLSRRIRGSSQEFQTGNLGHESFTSPKYSSTYRCQSDFELLYFGYGIYGEWLSL